ncbi:DUF6508 domain-containing protein [Carnobacterium divergens]|uniref:DUF6508 domain-containing protein n=1 Tax=Carnobacterium divergens TaxID=2748 RepID=A0AAW8RC88_CARDV|nr:DUF6508 domain-containing protein [Carnobacterium divergens]MDT1959165.1 DUF6508 domain-containing protein [Carnobacterium divergens]MDT1975053.1 DUF6508 domain-containing protein [Carnobacterium divergens]
MELDKKLVKNRLISFEKIIIDAQSQEHIDLGLDEINNFFTALDATDFIEIFDYNKWVKSINFDINSSEALANLDFETLRKVITYHVRIDRFIEGHLEELIKNGYFLNFIKVLKNK